MQSAYWNAALRDLVARHAKEMHSRYAAMLLLNWPQTLERFWQVVPKQHLKYLEAPLSDTAKPLRA